MPEQRRNFALLDAMILTAATAVGLALMRSSGRTFPVIGYQGLLRYVALGFEAIWISWYFLVAWGPSLLILRLLPPRQRLKKVLPEPGIVACSAATLAVTLQATYFLTLAGTIGVAAASSRGFLAQPNSMIDECGTRVVFSILGAWLALILVGQWCPVRNWMDRLGRIVGIAWIAGYLFVRGGMILFAVYK